MKPVRIQVGHDGHAIRATATVNHSDPYEMRRCPVQKRSLARLGLRVQLLPEPR